MSPKSAEKLVRPLVRKLHPYVPGEQPKIQGLIKLNTNENPYPPSKKVLQAVKAAVDGRLRLYPNPTAQTLREKLAKLHGCAVENIIAGNGSDELLAMAVRTFAEPADPANPSNPKALAQYFTPSYSLYPVLAEAHGAMPHGVPLETDFSLPKIPALKKGAIWNFKAGLTFVTTPNAPTGAAYATARLEELCQAQNGVVVLDEAYVDFAKENAMSLALKHPNVLVARTFSKAYSLCFQRVGYFVGPPALIDALHKIRDSYNVNGLGQAAAEATLDDLPYYRENFAKIIATRERVSAALGDLGFRVAPSQTNFILAAPPKFPAERWLELLRDRKLLVRWFKQPEINQYLRITIGSDTEMNAFLRAVKEILKEA